MERPLWDALALTTPLDKLIGAINTRLARWADLVARLQRYNVRSVTAATTLTENDDLLLVNTTGGGVAVNLPPVAGTRGKIYFIKKIDASANNVTLTDNASDLIDGAGTLVWNTQWQSYTVISSGATWNVV